MKEYVAAFGILAGFVICMMATVAAMFAVPGETCTECFVGGVVLTAMAWVVGRW
ncbi:MAG: hypothetical protein ACYTBJ_24830 [Planctomycetota bacterium]